MTQDTFVLHVEDEPHYQVMCKNAFQELGYDYKAVTTAEEAMQILDNQPVGLLIIDCFLRSNGINGDKMAEQVLAENKYTNPIIFVSSSERPAFIQKLKAQYSNSMITEAPKEHFLNRLKAFGQSNSNGTPTQLYQELDRQFAQ